MRSSGMRFGIFGIFGIWVRVRILLGTVPRERVEDSEGVCMVPEVDKKEGCLFYVHF